MNRSRRTLLGIAAAASATGFASALLWPGPAAAQDAFPAPGKTIRIVIPTAPGGNIDLMARLYAEKLQAAWGQRVIVESRAGGNGTLATAAVTSSAPDGQTALFVHSALVQNVVLNPNPGYRLADLAPASLLASFPIALAASAAIPADTLPDLVKLAKQKPGAMIFGSYGPGSGGHIIGAGLNKAAGIELTHVAYKGEAASYVDLVGGQIQVAYGSVGFYSQRLAEGKVKLLAVASPQRLPTFPNVPTFAELGYADVNLAGWGGLLLPAGTPDAVVEKWSAELQRITRLPEVQKRVLDMGFVPIGGDRKEFADLLSSDVQRWSAVVKANNIRLD